MSKNNIILIADHRKEERERLASMILQCGESVLAARNAKQVRFWADSVEPDIAFIKLLFCEESSLRLIKELKAQHPKVRIITLAPDRQDPLVDIAARVGACCHLQEPYEFMDIKAILLYAQEEKSTLTPALEIV
ncbi:MAG: response regulator [Bacteroidota bacterium]